jgi:isopenicillin-N epimerase
MIIASQDLKQEFLLDPEITFLNHGSFGATPRQVFERYQMWQCELEKQPVEFLGRKTPTLLSEARATLAKFLGTQRDNLVFVTNVTEAINIVARSLTLGPGDEVLSSDMEYGAIDRTWSYLAQKQGRLQSQGQAWKYINQPVSVPVQDQERVIGDIWRGVTARTRLISLSHISSPTAMIFPVKEICRRARDQGILTLIDGAHAPGQVDLNLDDLGADFYGGNCHKWLCAPKGSGFLFAAPVVQSLIEPLIVSWGWQSDSPGPSRFVDYLEWTGTRDISAFLAVPDAIEFVNSHNWTRVRQACHDLAAQALDHISRLTGLQPLYSPDSDWFGQMATARLPDSIDPAAFQFKLLSRFNIEVPIIKWNGQNLIRFSFQAYNSQDDLDRLVVALEELLC